MAYSAAGRLYILEIAFRRLDQSRLDDSTTIRAFEY
jgi:hypothetical protein